MLTSTRDGAEWAEICEQIRQNGGVAQLGEHLPCKQGVMGSNPIISTSDTKRYRKEGERGKREPLTTKAHSSGG